MKKLAMSALVEVAELKNFYTPQSLDSLKASIKEEGQKTPVVVSENYEIMHGYRIVDAMKELGEETVEVAVIEGKPLLSDYISRNHVREKTPDDKVKELRHLFERFPKRQGKRNPDGTPYSRDEKISEALKGRFKGDVIINKLEKVINNDLPGDILTKGIIENNWKVDTCYEYVSKWREVDANKKYGYTELLIKGVHSVSEVNKFIQEKESLDQKFDHTFSIPDKITVWNEDCNEIDRLLNHEPVLDLQFCSPPYWMLRNYNEEAKTDQIDENTNMEDAQNVTCQLGHEKTKEEYVENVSKVFKKVEAVIKETGSVIVNIAETYIDGVGQGIPFLLRDAILRNTNLKFKDTFIWSKKNSRPQGEKVKRLQNSIEYIFWFVKDIEKYKYKVLTFPVEGKEAKLVSGAKDVNKNGKVSKKSKNISKNYGKLVSHLKEQELENIITTSIGKDHELYKIISSGHPAPMSPMLPVTFALMLTDEGDLCADIFGGSQVSGKIFTLLNRRYVSTEKSKEYFNIGCQRLLNAANEFDQESLDVINELVYQSTEYSKNDENFIDNELLDNNFKPIIQNHNSNYKNSSDVTDFNSSRIEFEDGSIMFNGNNIEVLKTLADNSVDSVVTDGPYGIGLMGKKWDEQVPSMNTWLEVKRVLKPGGHILSFGHTRTYHKMALEIEKAGFQIRDQLFWIYGQGFPKSKDIGKSIDKILGNEREVVKEAVNNKIGLKLKYDRDESGWNKNSSYLVTKGNSDWEGWGTGLKPAVEPILMAMKPLSEKSFGENVLKWGTGGLNLKDSQIIEKLSDGTEKARWASNILIDERIAQIMDIEATRKSKSKRKKRKEKMINSPSSPNSEFNPSVNISKFFYVPKISPKDKNEGLDKLEKKSHRDTKGGSRDYNARCGNCGKKFIGSHKNICHCDNPVTDNTAYKNENFHTTVKPTELMQYLVRLVTPKNGICLDLFSGSGSTGKACIREGIKFILIEKESEYCDIAQARINYEIRLKNSSDNLN